MNFAGKTALVTGATGFLGGALTLRLADEGAHVRALARSPEKGAFLRGCTNLEIVTGDVTDADRMRELANGCDYVFHVAAMLGANAGGLKTMRVVNVQGTSNVANAAVDAGVERIVFVSSIAYYGYRHTQDVTENMPWTPSRDPYVITKREGECVVREAENERGLSYSIIRPGMIYGPRSGMWTGNVYRLARLRSTIWLGKGDGFAHPIHIDDVVQQMLIQAAHPAAHKQAFNSSPDPAPTWREFLGSYQRLAGNQRWLSIPYAPVNAVASAVGNLVSRSNDPMWLDFIRFTQRRITYKMTKARELLGWQPQIDLESGINSCAAWLRQEGLLA
ncbi:MAG: NAD(P)-dependent oxidoreductase [Burkholderiales bacterium]|nr:NAD(P)-dependent oxidoreductase [Anaerolineae bacterium]